MAMLDWNQSVSNARSGEAMALKKHSAHSLLRVGVMLGFLRSRIRNGPNCMCWLHASGTSSWNEMQKKSAFQRAQPKKELLKTMSFGAALKSPPFTGLKGANFRIAVKPPVRRWAYGRVVWLTIGPPGNRCVASPQSAPSLECQVMTSDDHSEPTKWEEVQGCPPVVSHYAAEAMASWH